MAASRPEVEASASTQNLFKVNGLGLYGRAKETKAIEQCYEDARTSRHLLLIGGPSGRGKSALSQYLQTYSAGKGGLHASGKYTLTQEGEPYSAISQTCAEICRKISEAHHLLACRDALRNELSPEAIEMISRVVPQMGCIVEEEKTPSNDDPNVTNYMDEKNQLHLSLRLFFQIICRFVQVALCLDDLQWADAASIELLEYLLTDQKNAKLLVVVCFRDDEVCDTHVFARFLRNKQIMKDRDSLGVTEILLDNISVDAIDEMLTDVLEGHIEGKVSASAISELAAVIYSKTKGNPFFTRQFWYLLGEDGLVRRDGSNHTWEWHIDEIRIFAHTIDDIVDLMHTKFKTLPPHMQNLTQLSACLGTTLRLDVLNVVAKEYYLTGNDSSRSFFGIGFTSTLPEVSARQFVEELCQREFLEVINDNEYRWTHDKIEESAYKLLPSKTLRKLQHNLGDMLSSELTDEQLVHNLFTVVRLLNKSSRLIGAADSHKRVKLAEMNLKAGKRSIAASDFGAASKYFGTAVSLLPSNKWTVYHDLSLEVYSLAAEADYCAGNFAAMDKHGNEVVKRHNLSTLQKRRAYTALMQGLAAQGRYKDAIDICVELLSKLQCHIPKHLVLLRILPGLMHANSKVEKNTTSDALVDKTNTEEDKLWVMSLLDHLTNYAYVAEMQDMLAAGIVKSYQWTLKYGFCNNSPPTFARVGLVLASVVGNVKAGHEYASYALQLLSGVKEKRVVSQVKFQAYVLVMHRLSDVDYHCLIEGREAGMAAGDVEMGCWNSHFALEHGLLSGKIHLDSLAADATAYVTEMRELRQEMVQDVARMLWQVISNLRGEEGNTGRAALTGDVIDEETALEGVDTGKKSPLYRPILRRFQYTASFWFEDWDRFLEHFEDTPEAAIHKAMPGLFVSHILTAYICLGMLSLYRVHRKKKHLTVAKSLKTKVKQWVSEGNPNFVHFLRLIEAEMIDVNGGSKKKQDVDALYQEAAQIALDRGAVHDEALCCQRHGEYCLRNGQLAEGKMQLQRALKRYAAWGAREKVRQLKEKHSEIFSDE